MFAATLTFLAKTIIDKCKAIAGLMENPAAWGDWFQFIFALAMFVLAIILLVEGFKTFAAQNKKAA